MPQDLAERLIHTDCLHFRAELATNCEGVLKEDRGVEKGVLTINWPAFATQKQTSCCVFCEVIPSLVEGSTKGPFETPSY